MTSYGFCYGISCMAKGRQFTIQLEHRTMKKQKLASVRYPLDCTVWAGTQQQIRGLASDRVRDTTTNQLRVPVSGAIQVVPLYLHFQHRSSSVCLPTRKQKS